MADTNNTERAAFDAEFAKLGYQWSDDNREKAYLGWKLALAAPQPNAAPLEAAVRKLHAAKGRYHTQLACCDLYDLLGLPNVRPGQEPESQPNAALADGWMPIETAPKDSTSRLVWCPDRQNTYAVTWLKKHGWLIFGGRLLTEEPTHWRPLPAPPTLKENKEVSS